MSLSRHFVVISALMCIAVTASNILVQYPVRWWGLDEILTYGAFTYPFAFLINDLTNRRFGPQTAKKIVYVGFIFGLFVSWLLATPRLAIASGLAYLCGQLLDIFVFTPLRKKAWWIAPLFAGICGALIDTLIFFSTAFSGHFAFIDRLTGRSDSSLYLSAKILGFDSPLWVSLGLGDLSIKLIMALLMLIPYGVILAFFMPNLYAPGFQARQG